MIRAKNLKQTEWNSVDCKRFFFHTKMIVLTLMPVKRSGFKGVSGERRSKKSRPKKTQARIFLFKSGMWGTIIIHSILTRNENPLPCVHLHRTFVACDHESSCNYNHCNKKYISVMKTKCCSIIEIFECATFLLNMD